MKYNMIYIYICKETYKYIYIYTYIQPHLVILNSVITEFVLDIYTHHCDQMSIFGCT